MNVLKSIIRSSFCNQGIRHQGVDKTQSMQKPLTFFRSILQQIQTITTLDIIIILVMILIIIVSNKATG